MNISVRQQIIQAVVLALNTDTPAGVPRTTRTNISIEEKDQLPIISVYPTRETVNDKPVSQGRWGPLIERSMYLRFACLADGPVPDAEADPMGVWVGTTLSGNLFGGLVTEAVEDGTEWIYSETDEQVVGMFVDFRIDYTTSRTDPTSTT